MSSSPPPSVPTIASVPASPTPPERPTQSPGGGGFLSSSRTTGRSPSPRNRITSPTPLSRSSTLLQTPPIPDPLSRQDKGGYFSSNRARSASRNTRTTSPDSHSIRCLSPGLSSGGSFRSSDTGQSQASYSSGELLSPPQFQVDDEKPPYIPRSRSSESLSMMNTRLRRAQTIPNDKKVKVKRRHRRRHGCRHCRSKKEYDHSCSGGSGCQTAPTASAGQRQLCSGHAGQLVPSRTHLGNSDTFGRLLPQSTPGPAPPLVNRRWSSVDVGANQSGLRTSLLSSVTKVASTHGSIHGGRDGGGTAQALGHRDRTSTVTRGAIDHDIVQAIRARLTFRKVLTDELESPVEPPLSITLRRASGASSVSGISGIGGISQVNNAPNDSNFYSATESGATTPLARAQGHPSHTPPSAAFLITSEDIDSIALLIAENLRQDLHSYNRNQVLDDTNSTTQSSRNIRAPTMSSSGAREPSPVAAEPTTSVTDFQPANVQPSNQSDFLQVKNLKRPIERSSSKKSEHEVLWKVCRESTGSFGSDVSGGERKLSDTSSESETSQDLAEKPQQKQVVDKGDAFDPNNASASISEWSLRLPQNDITMVVTSSDSESNDVTPKSTPKSTPNSDKTKVKPTRRPLLRSVSSTPKERLATRVRPFPRYAASHEQLQDVVSFPPLSPRKATEEWFSPLPDMETGSPLSTPSPTTYRSLYGLGVDVTPGPTGSSVPKSPFTSWIRSTEVSPSQSPGIEFRQDYGFGKPRKSSGTNQDTRRKSVIRPHPKASPRTGQTFAMGSAIGVHGSERRKSSAPRIQRVRTIDNIHKGERDEPPSRWRPPSICPARLSTSQMSASPAESEDSKKRMSEERVPEVVTRLQALRSGITDRISLVEARSPPLPKSDCAGIYGTITGTLRKSIGAACQDYAPQHDCDDCANVPRSPSIDWIG